MKPTLALTHLNRREPIVYFGCTWTEIKTGVWRGAAVALPVTAALMAALSPPVLMIVPGLCLWLVVTRMFLNHINRHRAGKPLFYERHRKGRARPRSFARTPCINSGDRSPEASRRAIRVSRAHPEGNVPWPLPKPPLGKRSRSCVSETASSFCFFSCWSCWGSGFADSDPAQRVCAAGSHLAAIRATNEVSPSYVHAFAKLMMEALNYCPEDCGSDYARTCRGIATI